MGASTASPEFIPGDLAVFRGQGMLVDFKTAVDIAEEINNFESWLIAGDEQSDFVFQVANRPLYAEESLATNGLARLLDSGEEKTRMGEILEETKELDMQKYIGQRATFKAEDRSIIKMDKGNAVHGNPWVESILGNRKKKTADITSFRPAAGLICIGEGRGGKYNPTVIGKGFWKVYPFDPDTGRQKVSAAINNPKS